MRSEEAGKYLTKKVLEIAKATGCDYVNITLSKLSFGAFIDRDGEPCRHYASAYTDNSGKTVDGVAIDLFDR